jgi:RNA polymerase sigma factor (sigma-70 family)
MSQGGWNRWTRPDPLGQKAVSRDAASATKGPDELAMNAWLGERLRRALATLPPSYRMIVLLREMEGLSTREVATVSGMTEDNVKTRLHRARVMLREVLAGQEAR